MRLGDAYAWAMARPSGADGRSLGFSMLAAGALAGLVGVGAVLFAQDAQGMQRYVYREIAGASLSLALAAFLAGAAASLPLRRVSKAAAAVGFAFCLTGIVAFVWLYPFNWNVAGRDSSPLAIVTYALGLAYLVAASTSGLIHAYVESRERRNQANDAELTPEFTDEDVVRDILETTSRSKLSWGGVRVDDRVLTLSELGINTKPLQGNIDKLGIVQNIDGEDFPDDVDALLNFRGVKGKANEEYDDSPAAALARLRQERAAQAQTTWWQRLLSWWSSWWNGPTT